MASFPSSLLPLLEDWRKLCVDSPQTCASDMLYDIGRLPSCFDEPKDWCYVAGGVAILGFILMTILAVCLLRLLRSCCRKRSIQSRPLPTPPGVATKLLQKEKKELEKKKQVRIKQEQDKKIKAGSAAEGLVDIYSMQGIEYQKDRPLPDIGSRLEKYWYRVISHETDEQHILTIGYLSASFTCSLEVEGYIKEQLSQLSHTYLQDINDIKFMKQRDGKDKPQVAIVQPFWEMGSLKDLIYKADPLTDWAQKYNKVADPLPVDKVSLFGGQILQAVLYLYGRGYNPLGHIQTGNIYIQGDDTCRLGGYENTLLKNRARLHRTCVNFKCLDAIDTIMFGHVIYEMSAGKELAHLVPNEEEYRYVLNDRCKEVLQFIFTRNTNGTFERSMKEIQANRFFSGPHQPVQASKAIPKQNSVSPPVTSKPSKLGFLAKGKNKKQGQI